MRLAVLLGAALLLLPGLGRIDAWAPDEPRYLEVADEMGPALRGPSGFVIPHLGGRPYDQKPPLYFWLAALAGAPGARVDEAAARLPSALAGLGCVALTLSLGARLFGGRVGLLGAALLATVFEFANLARRVQLDVLLALLESGALVLFWRIGRGLGPRRPQVAALHACLGLAVLTKGPVGFLVPMLAMIVFLAWERRLRDLRHLVPPWALLLSLGPGLAWLAAATALGPEGFSAGMLGENLLGRFFRGTSHARPIYYYLYQLPLDFLPWTLLAPALWRSRGVLAAPSAVRRGAAEERRAAAGGAAAERAAVALHGERRSEGVRRAWRFLLAWVGASFVFFSLSGGKRGLYLLPAFPALALLLADAVCRELAGRSSVPRSLGAGLAAGTALVAAASAAAIALASVPASFGRRAAAMVATLDRGDLLAFGCAALGVTLAGLAAWIVTRRHGTAGLRRLAIPVVGAWAVELAAFQLLYPALDAARSPRPIAAAAAAATPVGEPIGLVSDRSMLGGLAYYGGRRIVPLRSSESIRAFLDGGGRTFVVKERKLARVTALTPVREVGRARAGRRAVVVVVADGAVR
jgi:4-amino-4-deoxy-L-arabinose transferase-like glycosyltransferase